MNRFWPQQPVFAERVREFCSRNGLLTPRGAIRMDAVADLFGLHTDTMRQLLQGTSRRRPHLNTLNAIAGQIGCSVFEFLDAPKDPPPAMPHERWEGLSEVERGLVVSVVAEMSSEDLSAEERAELHRNFMEAKERMLRQKAMWAASCPRAGRG
jgi:transcriptional regulator with XRE-family HTH domain